MKKLTIAILTGLMSVSGWGACTYNFDASLSQIQTITGYSVPNLALFPQNSNQKVGLTLQSGMPVGSSGDVMMHYGTSSTYANNTIEYVKTKSGTLGDKTLPSNGMFAIEFNYKVPSTLSQGGLSTSIGFGGNMENGKVFQVGTFYTNGNDGNNSSNKFWFSLLAEGTSQVNLNNLNGSQVINATQLQKIGIYINQASNQIGLVVNGVNQGYVYTLPSKANNFGVMLTALSQNIAIGDANKQFSVELITDASKMTQTYPTGAKDVCGNTI
ncbi:MAG: DUF4882 domain-containing protein [Acinetobacter sp.]|jgi:hypothetical protein|uniref:DUF4882 family protein n=1 Tax=Acinetobacter sp. TaxID=472 RepID=UPI00283FBD35|nr:DUF4882 family protein [Acinetobacter sp.]MDR3030350.1 DUF4882 domain-containing protein [Acinetobacter sp.]